MSTGGEVANALVCKTSIRGFNSRPVLQSFLGLLEDISGFGQKLLAPNLSFHRIMPGIPL